MRICFLSTVAVVLAACSRLPDVTPKALLPPAGRIVMQPLPPAIPCSEDPSIATHVAKQGQEEDRANAYDTPETVAAIDRHNAARKAVCP